MHPQKRLRVEPREPIGVKTSERSRISQSERPMVSESSWALVQSIFPTRLLNNQVFAMIKVAKFLQRPPRDVLHISIQCQPVMG